MTTVRTFDGAAVAGFAELPLVKDTPCTTRNLIASAAAAALRHAGLGIHDVDGFAVSGFTLAPDHAVDVANALGLRVGWLAPQEPGGASGISTLMAAARAVTAGDAQVVLCAAGDVMPVRRLRELVNAFSTELGTWLAPIGAASANIEFALFQRRHMDAFGTTREQLGRVSVAQRTNGAANPLALFRTPVTLEEYLAAPAIAAPIHLLDCVHPACGAAAFVVTSAERARAIGRDLARVAAGAEVHGRPPNPQDPFHFGWSDFVDELYDRAGAGPDDFDVVQCYDDYPIMVCCQLEELGFCERGAGGEFLEGHDLTFGGDFPLNTGGGLLACGQAGAASSYLPLVEGLRQLAGEGGDRQVPGASTALVSGLGMAGYHRPQSFAAAVLRRP